MKVSRQLTKGAPDPQRGPRARTRRLMLETATRLMQSGATPSISEVAQAAEVSRATAYRYFPSQAALVHAVVDQALGPILMQSRAGSDAAERVDDLFRRSMPRIQEFEATFKAALKLSLDQWAKRQAGALGDEPPLTRGHRIDLLEDALAPLRGELAEDEFQRLAQALSLLFGVEALVVLKDIWNQDAAQVEAVTRWAASALVRAATAGRA
ncbi:TetR/AcrR family transcriptional regulator [Aquibium carbonis]|uniref:TetR/AcrR family transcriptional regulator n=1 Tax=Aquibium carbonis TaxID=2495581 RepID=A0A3R9YCM9_9HYPH|nr:TetR/AcrR family transcriptional regulator [Aquibium carbonis]RST84624.1 TetR/AcrR family transcriptional regulator [Aquibium carbonis]